MSIESHFESCVAWSSFSTNITIQIVLDHDDFLAAIRVCLEHSLNGGVRGLALTSGNVPSIKLNGLD